MLTAFVCIIGLLAAVSSWRPPTSYPCPSFACTVPIVIMSVPGCSSSIIVSGVGVLSNCRMLVTFRRSILFWVRVVDVVVSLGLCCLASSRPAAVVMSWVRCVAGCSSWIRATLPMDAGPVEVSWGGRRLLVWRLWRCRFSRLWWCRLLGMVVVAVVVYLVMGRRFAALCLVNLLVLAKLRLPRAIVNLDVVGLVMIIVKLLMVVVEVLYYHL